MIEQFRKEQVKKTWQTYSCKDGCIYSTKAVRMSNDPNSNDWLFKCEVLDLIIPMDGDIGKLGCGSFTKVAPDTRAPTMPLPESDVHIQETEIKEPVAAPMPSEIAAASEQIIILEPAQPQPVPSEIAAASEQIIILEPAQPQPEPMPSEPMPKRKRGRPPSQKQPQPEPMPSEPMPSTPAYTKEEREIVIQEPMPSEPMPKRKRGRPAGSKIKSKEQENDGDNNPQTQDSAKES